MEKKFETFLFLLFFATLMVPLSMKVVGEAKIYMFDFPLVMMYSTFFARICLRRMRLSFDGFDFWFLLFYAWVIVCAFEGQDFGVSLEWILYWLRGYLIIFYMRHHCGGLISDRLFFIAIGFCLLFEPALAIIQTITQSSIGAVQQYFGVLKSHQSGWVYEGMRVTRAQGTFMHTNFLGNWLIMLMPFLQARLTDEQQKLRKMYVIWWLMCLAALVLTLSRANWVAFVLGFATVLFAESRYRAVSVRKRKWAAYVMTPVIMLAIAYTLFTEELDYVAEIAIARAERTFDDKSSNLRSDLVVGALTVLKGNPFMGVGSGNSNALIFESNPFIPDDFRATVHNVYLIIATENGVIGAMLFVILMIWPLQQLLKVLGKGGAELSREGGDNAIGFVAGLISLYFAMLWYVGMFHESEFPLWMTLIGAALGKSAQLMRKLRASAVKTTAEVRPQHFLPGVVA